MKLKLYVPPIYPNTIDILVDDGMEDDESELVAVIHQCRKGNELQNKIDILKRAHVFVASYDLLEALQNMVKLFEVRDDLTFDQRMSIDISKEAIEKAQ
jgi:hypothetical protein